MVGVTKFKSSEPSHVLWEKARLRALTPENEILASQTRISMLAGLFSDEPTETFSPPAPPPTYFHPSTAKLQKNEEKETSISIFMDVGFFNALFLRGTGPGMSWEKGVPLVNVNANHWEWKSSTPFDEFEFKIVLNDTQFEGGENHRIQFGESLKHTPNF